MGPSVDDRHFQRFVVRVRRQEGGSGSGVLVAPGWVLTCAHVVRSHSDVLVDLHPEARSGGSYAEADRSVTGTVTHSSPTRSDHSPSAFWPFPDLALVRIPHEDHIFAPLSEVPFGSVSDGIHAWGFGLREDDQTSPGVPGQYQWAGQDGDGMLQLQTGHVPRGISGAPIVSTTGGVFGLISVSRDPNDAHGGWASPVIALSSLAPRVDDAPPAEEVWRANQENAWKYREAWARATLAGADNPLDRPWETAQFNPARDAPSTLLLPHIRAVKLVAVEAPLSALHAWCDAGDDLSIRTIQDLGGTGKTRIAVELARQRSKGGWVTGFLLGDSQTVPDRGPRLVVVDYASQQESKSRYTAFVRLTSTASQLEPVRILLLDRRSNNSSTLAMQLKSASGPAKLKNALNRCGSAYAATSELNEVERANLFRNAFETFRGVRNSDGREKSPLSFEVDLSDARYAKPLDIIVLAFSMTTFEDSHSGDPFSCLLDHEFTHWEGRLKLVGTLTREMLEALIALVTLFGARTEDEKDPILHAAEIPERIRGHVDRIAGDMYPGQWLWNPLRPDRVGEIFLARWLEVDSDKAVQVAGLAAKKASLSQLEYAFSTLERLHHPKGASVVDILSVHLPSAIQDSLTAEVARAASLLDGQLPESVGHETLRGALAVASLFGARDCEEVEILLDALSLSGSTREAIDAAIVNAFPGPWRWNPLHSNRLVTSLISGWVNVATAGAREIVIAVARVGSLAQLARAFTIACELPADAATPFATLLATHANELRSRAEPVPSETASLLERTYASENVAHVRRELIVSLGKFIGRIDFISLGLSNLELSRLGVPPFLNWLAFHLPESGLAESAGIAATFAARICNDILLEDDRDVTALQNLAESKDRLGDLAGTEGDSSLAREYYKEAMELRRRLASSVEKEIALAPKVPRAVK